MQQWISVDYWEVKIMYIRSVENKMAFIKRSHNMLYLNEALELIWFTFDKWESNLREAKWVTPSYMASWGQIQI